jgi:hypothetical protein
MRVRVRRAREALERSETQKFEEGPFGPAKFMRDLVIKKDGELRGADAIMGIPRKCLERILPILGQGTKHPDLAALAALLRLREGVRRAAFFPRGHMVTFALKLLIIGGMAFAKQRNVQSDGHSPSFAKRMFSERQISIP